MWHRAYFCFVIPYNVILETERLVLRGWNQETYDVVFGQYLDEDIKKFIGVVEDSEWELERNRYHGGYSTYNLTIQFFQLVSKSDQRILGWCGFHSWAKQHRRAEVFYLLKREEDKRQGWMSEALEVVLQYGREAMQLRRVEAFVAIDNMASCRLLEKNGFRQEATVQHRYLFGDDVEWDHFYALLME